MIAEKTLWLSARDAARILGISHAMFPRVAAAADVRRKEVPGMHARYWREDIERIAAEALKGGDLAGPQTKKGERSGAPGSSSPIARPQQRTA